jgi:NADPH-dependent 7-cyano-7-deazaguanine reductase QueF
MTEQEKMLLYKTSFILRKDTSQMKLNDIIDELIHVLESKMGSSISNNGKINF